MPKLRQKSCSQARKAKTALMRQKREADRRIDISDRSVVRLNGCEKIGVNPDAATPDEGRHDSTGPLWPVPNVASASGPSGMGTDGPFCLSVQGTDKQMGVNARLSEPSGPSAPYGLPCDLPTDTLDDLPSCMLTASSGLLSETTKETDKTFQFHNTMCSSQIESSVLTGCELPYVAVPVSRPAGSDIFILGSFHQGESIFSVESRGRQCTLNAMCSLIHANYSRLNSSIDLDNVLLDGDSLYKKTVTELQRTNRFRNFLLNFDELPVNINIMNKQISVTKLEVISGVCTQQFATMSLPSLYQSLDTAFTKSSYLLLMMGSVCSAVFKREDQYFFFDSHSHGLTGLSSENGTSILISFHQLQDLVTYMYALYDSMLIDITAQFDLLPVRFANVFCEPAMSLSEHEVELVNVVTASPGLNEWETVTNKRKKKSPSHHSTACEKETAPQTSNCDSCETLIGKYFKDQMQRSKLKQTKKQKMPSRTVYMRTYMQEKRQCEEFKYKDKQYSLESKRNARQSDEYQKKDRQYTLQSMSNARQSEEYQKKDRQRSLQSKRNARQSDEYQKKDRQYTLQSMSNARQSEEYQKKDRQRSLQSKRNARQSDEYQKKDRQYTLQSMSNARQSEKYQKKDRERSLQSKRNARQSDEYQKKDRQYTLQSMSNARQSEEYQKKDRERSLQSKRNARQSDEYQKKDRQYTLQSMSNARQSEEYQKKDRERSLQSKRNARQSDEYQKKDRQYTLQSMSNARQSEEYQKKDRQRSLQSKRNARQSEKFREKEKEKEKMSKRRARIVEEFKVWEAKQRREKRTSDDIKQRELEIQNKSKRKLRSNPYNLEKERIAKQQWRLDARSKNAEKVMDRKRKVLKRKDPSFSEAEILQRKRRQCGQDIDTCIDRFQERISVGPLYICSCCHQTWFKHSVTEVKYLTCNEKEKFVTGVVSVDNKEWVCRTCKSSINSGKVPKLSVLNGMEWPCKPKELELFSLEERLIALRIPFMQLRELPRGRQLSIKGNVVNVPVDIQPVVNALPRPFDENVTVPVKLKKKMSFKSCAFSENVRPHKVLVALHWLMKNSELYKNANVEIDEHWIESVTANSNQILNEFFESQVEILKDTSYEDFDSCMADLLEEYTYDQDYSTLLRSCFQTLIKHASNFDVEDFENVSAEIHDHFTCEEKSRHQTLDITDNCEELYDSDAEEVAQENVGNIDTLLDDANLENRNTTFTFAPGEGQRPLSIFQDTDSEYLCFPSIFCGKRRLENEARIVPVNYSDIAKWELRSPDRRAANCVPDIFFKLKKIQMKQLNNKANLAVRRCRTGTSNVTVAQVMNSEYIDNIVRNDEGYYLFKQLRNSPSYLESRKKDVYAMLRQLGMPTWFMSLSSADTRWTDLLKMLATLNDKVNYSDEQIEGLSWEQKIKLIQSDPVTCSRYFDHRVQEFINTVLKSEHKPLGEIADYFYRVEFQQRGSPHIHMIVWVKNAPKYKVDSINDLTTYVDQYLTCSISNPAVGSLVEIQTHKHSRTCRKREDRLCRFGYPLPPIPNTMILEPLEIDRDKYYKLYQQLQKKMNDEKDGYSMSYETFLTNVVQMSEEDYIKCIRSSLNSPKVFLKRHPSEIRVNLYNEHVLKGWRANVDIQFVLDPYACAMYIVSYISKSQRGMSNLLHAAAKEARNGNLDIKRQVRHIGNVFSNSVEVSAQEAVYLVLQMPLTKSTRDVVFINTSTPNERVQLLKPASVLENMPAESTDIMSDNVIKRYSKRPKVLQHYCLADYVSLFEVIYPDGNVDSDERNDDENNMEVTDDEDLEEIETVINLKSGIKIRTRQNSKVIRYVRFSRKTDEENHYREKLLLFHPWRNELTDLLPANFSTYKEHYKSLKETVDQKCSYYEHHAEELEIARDLAEAEYDAFDEIAPGTQQVEAETAEEETVESETFIYFNPDRAAEHREYDIGIEIGCSVSAPQILSNENLLSDEDYRCLLQSLNIKQKQFYNHVIHWVKTKDAPLYTFLSGGAGVGKSVVVKALYQTLYRILNLKEGENPDDIRVLLCAYTGKAAFNINGSTISSAFKQKYKQANQTLTCDALNTFRSKYKNLSVVIIDEISMVSNGMLNFISQRLQELKGTRIPFGGVSVIVVGDLFQLKPVSGDWIFNDLTRDAEALSINLWKEHFSLYELTEIMRQKDDLKFAELLNRLRSNCLTDDDKTVLKQCEINTDAQNYQKDSPHLFAENYYMHIFNEKIIDSLNTQKVLIPCHDSVVFPKLSNEKQKEAILKLPTDPNKTANLHCQLLVVVGMIYDLTVNVDTEDGLANGASCIVKHVEYKQKETNRPSVIWVQFDEAKAGNETRIKYRNRGFYHSEIDHNWTPIFDIERSFTYNKKTFERIQYPLQPSAGRSVHRAQGTTLESAVIDLSQRKTRKVPHLHYVALSRVKSLDKLQILNFNEQALQVDQKVKTEMDRLQNSARLELCYVPLELVDSTLKVAFNNCRSLHKHFKDVKYDHTLMSSHIFGLAETRLCYSDTDAEYGIDGFRLIRNDQSSQSPTHRPSHGIAVYVRNEMNISSYCSFNSENFEFTIVKIVQGNQEVQIVVLYKSPNMSDSIFRTFLRDELLQRVSLSTPIVILGDFNIDVAVKSRPVLQYLSERLVCEQLVNEPTTDYLTTLDLIFSNLDATVGTVETYWSDHKIIYLYKK